MSAPPLDRLSAAWGALVDWWIGRKAAKTLDACARYWGVVAKVSGSLVDVMLDSREIASPSGVPLYLGIPGSRVSGIEGMRVLVGFRNGDPSQPFVDDFEQGAADPSITIGTTSPSPASRKGDPVRVEGMSAATPTALTFAVVDSMGASGTVGISVIAGALAVVAVPPTLAPPFYFVGAITDGSTKISIGA